MTRPQSTRCSPFILALSVFLLAFTLRLIFAFQWHEMPYGEQPLLDAHSYDQWALSILNGKGMNDQAFYQSPIYPYVLAGLYQITGYHTLSASILNDILDSATAALLSLITLSLFGRTAAITAGILAISYGPMVFYTAPVMKEPLILFVLTLFVMSALHTLRQPRLWNYALSGLCLGLVIIARGNALLLLPLLPTFAWRSYHRTALPGISLFITVIFLTLLPSTLHNYMATQSFIPVTYADGFNLYIGHSPTANGRNAYPPEISTDPEHEQLETRWAAEQETGRPLNPADISSFWREKALNFVWQHPQRELELLGLKFLSFWSDTDSFDNYDRSFIKKNFLSVLNLPLTGFWLISTLAAFTIGSGLWFEKPIKKRQSYLFLLACIFLYMLSVLIFYVTDRYRLPVIAFLIPFAGASVPYAQTLWSRKLQQQCLGALGGTLLFLILALYTPLPSADLSAFDWGVLTTLYADRGDAASALNAFQKGYNISETGLGAQAYIRAAEMYEKEGEPTQASDLIHQAVDLFPGDGITFYNLARLQASEGHLDDALITLRHAKELAPTYGLIYYALVIIYEKKKDPKNAADALHAGLKADPDAPQLRALLQGQHTP